MSISAYRWRTRRPGPIDFRATGKTRPDQINGLTLWLDAGYISGLADGASVETWVDRSISANHATQSNASLRPTYQTNEANGWPVVRFNGTDQWFDLTSTLNIQVMTLVCVIKPTTPDGYRSVFGSNTNGISFQIADNAKMSLVKTNALGLLEQTTAISTSVFSVLTGTYSNPNAAIFTNRNADGTASVAAGFTYTNSYIGKQDSTGSYQYWYGDIAECLVYNNVLSSENKTLLWDYLLDKYAIP